MFLKELVNSHSKFQLESIATTDGNSNRYDFNLSKHWHWSLYSVGQYNNIIIKPECGVSLRKTDLSNIKMNVSFPKEHLDQITSNLSRCSVYRKKIAAVLLDRDCFAFI